MATRPKTFVAKVKFTASASTFEAGDVVTGVPLASALKFGDRFVESEREAKKTTTHQPADKVETEGD